MNMEGSTTFNKHSEFYFEDLYLQVEGTIFKILRRTIENDSETFRDMFSLSDASQGQVMEGTCPENPIVLEGISKFEMEQLLTVLYPKHFGQSPELSRDGWIGVLRLAKLWNIAGVRDLALSHLLTLADPLTKVELFVDPTNELNPQEWLLPAMLALTSRDEPPTIEEGNRLGMGTTLQLCSVREKFAEKRGWISNAEKESTLRTIICSVFNIPVPERQALRLLAGMK